MRAALTVLVVFACANAPAQEAVELEAARQQAGAADPRLRQLELEAAQSALRLRNIEAERRPALSIEGQAQYQSDVVQFPFRPPDGSAPPSVLKDTFDAHLGVEQPILDPTTRAKADAERARMAEAQARIRTTLFALRQEVDDAFFAAALLQERETQVTLAITDLRRGCARRACAWRRERRCPARPSPSRRRSCNAGRRRSSSAPGGVPPWPGWPSSRAGR